MKHIKYARYLLFAILLYFAFKSIAHELPNVQKASQVIKNIDVFFLGLAILFQAGQYIGDGMLSQQLLRSINFKINFGDTFRIASLNVFAAHLLPVGQAGAFATSYYFYKALGVPTKAIIFLSLAWGVITNTVLVLLCIFSLAFVPSITIPLKPSAQAVTIFAILLLTITGAILMRKKIAKMFRKNEKIQTQIVEFFEAFGTYKKDCLAHKTNLFWSIVGVLIYFFSNVATLGFSFLAVGSSQPFALLTFAFSASLLLGIVTLAPAGLGATEAAMILIFAQAHVDPTISIAAILIFRLITFWIPIPAGAIAYASLKKSIKKHK